MANALPGVPRAAGRQESARRPSALPRVPCAAPATSVGEVREEEAAATRRVPASTRQPIAHPGPAPQPASTHPRRSRSLSRLANPAAAPSVALA